MKQTFLLVIVVCILLSCSSKNKKQSAGILPIQKPEKSLSISSVGIVQFVKSFSDIQNLRSQKEIDKFMAKMDRTNPGFMHESFRKDTIDIFLKNVFEKIGFVKDDELLLSKFIYSTKPNTTIKNASEKEIKFHLYRDTVSGQHDLITCFYAKDSAEIKASFHEKIKYAFLDIIPGGNKELVVLDEHYFMNTEFYYFEVFEIKTKD